MMETARICWGHKVQLDSRHIFRNIHKHDVQWIKAGGNLGFCRFIIFLWGSSFFSTARKKQQTKHCEYNACGSKLFQGGILFQAPW